MRVVVGPVVVGDRICRIVSPVDSLLEVEEWAGSWWEPSSIPLTLAGTAPLADVSSLSAHGVPTTDWVLAIDAATRANIEAMILPQGRAAAEAMELDQNVHRGEGPRPREYPGNARFGLPRQVKAPAGNRDVPADRPRRRGRST